MPLRDTSSTCHCQRLKPGLLLLVTDDATQLAQAAADLVSEALRNVPRSVLALPTGRTSIGFYAALVAMHRRQAISLRFATTFNLDEFVGLPASHPGTYRSFMRYHLFEHVDIEPGNAHVPDGEALDLAGECDRYESMVARAGGIDLAVLGIGENGHIGFNEPGSPLDSRTRVVDLAPASRRANAHLFERLSDVPSRAITMGIGTILEARRLILLANGSAKADALHRALRGPVATSLPASALQLHPNVVVIADREASSKLL